MNFNEFKKSGIFEIDVINALEYCKANNVNLLEFDKGEYIFNSDFLNEGIYRISNHGSNGMKKAAFLIKDMKNFTIDGGGSNFIMNGIACGFILDNCENITIKNTAIEERVRFTCSGLVTEVCEDYFICDTKINEPYYIERGLLCFGDKESKNSAVGGFIECNMQKKRFREDSSDYWIGNSGDAVFEDLGNGQFKISKTAKKPFLGNFVVFMAGIGTRLAPALFAVDSKNINIENYTVYSCMGMGVIAQKCENVTIDNMKTECKGNECYSASADATHFVACRGMITVRNSSFEGQLDDCLNVHGIYNRIIEKGKNYIVIKYMHHEAKGIDIYEAGAKIEISDKDSLIPYLDFTVTKIMRLNDDCTVLYLDGDTDKINLNDVTEDITRCPDVLFENNKACFNRARGMLLASRGKTIIRNNWFNTPGTAILFESDGAFWFESGATHDVIIENNVFDECCYTEWGNKVINVCKRRKHEDGKFFHKNIIVRNNIFKNCNCPPYEIHDTENFIFENNIKK